MNAYEWEQQHKIDSALAGNADYIASGIAGYGHGVNNSRRIADALERLEQQRFEDSLSDEEYLAYERQRQVLAAWVLAIFVVVVVGFLLWPSP